MITIFFVGAAFLIFDRVMKSDLVPVPVKVKAFHKKRK